MSFSLCYGAGSGDNAGPIHTKGGVLLDRELAIGASGGAEASAQLAEKPGHDEHHLLGDVDGVVADPLQAAGDEDHEHRPLADVGIVAGLDGAPEDLAVEPVDLGVLADEVARQSTLRVPNASLASDTCERASWPIRSIESRISLSFGAS